MEGLGFIFGIEIGGRGVGGVLRRERVVRGRPRVVLEANVGVAGEERGEWLRSVREVAGQPEAAQVLNAVWNSGHGEISIGVDDRVELTSAAFPFPLDEFQLKAIRALARGESAVVSAPTGSGKTVVGEAAVYMALAAGLRVFYTTPLKALSNQKFNDFKRQFGAHRVGLLTGDVSANREADIVVMTTEVYRNMLYATESGFEVSGVLPSILDNVYAVVFDEFHFMNDRERGTVWEESVIISPKQMLLVALSATMRNVDEVRAWFQEVHGPTELVVSSYRPVPLDFAYSNRTGLFSLFSSKQNARGDRMINPKVCSPDVIKAAAMRVEHRGIAGDWDDDVRKGKKPRRGKRRASPAEIAKEVDYMLEEGLKKGKMLKVMNAKPLPQEIPSFGYLVRCLRVRKLLPVIVFVFSRGGCDRAASLVGEGEKTPLLTPEESQLVDKRLSEFEARHPNLVGEDKLRLARLGVASHHAGLLPLWKAMVEELFQDGLIKAVFATETLAAGINMPARTTAISSLSKRAGSEGIVELRTSEVLQMAGRAGRRGKDKRGTCVFVRSHFEGAEVAYHVINQPVDRLNSTFSATYGMALNLLRRRDLEESKQLVEKSFGAFLIRQGRKKRTSGDETMAEAEQFLNAKRLLESLPLNEVSQLVKISDRLRTEQKVLKKLAQIALGDVYEDMTNLRPFLAPGTPAIVVQPDVDMSALQVRKLIMEREMKMRREDPLELTEFAVIVGHGDGDSCPVDYSAVLTQDNTIRLVSVEHIVHVDAEMESVQFDGIPEDEWMSRFVPNRRDMDVTLNGQFAAEGSAESAPVAALIPKVDLPVTPGHIMAQRALTEEVRQRLVSSSLYGYENRRDIVRAFKTAKKLKKRFTIDELKAVEKKMDKLLSEEQSNWKVFLSASNVLMEFGFLTSDYEVTTIGELGASLRSSNELWMSLVLLSDSIGNLQPQQLAGVLSALLAEGARKEQIITFVPDPETLEAIDEIRPFWEKLELAQRKRKIDIPVTLDESDAGLVEAWANGTSWQELLSGTNLQEGDICRRLRRVMDMLRQIAHLPLISEAIKLSARRAVALMDRFPVADDVTYVVPKGAKATEEADNEVISEEKYIESVMEYSGEDDEEAAELESSDLDEEDVAHENGRSRAAFMDDDEDDDEDDDFSDEEDEAESFPESDDESETSLQTDASSLGDSDDEETPDRLLASRKTPTDSTDNDSS